MLTFDIYEPDVWLYGVKVHPGEVRLSKFIIHHIKSNDVFFDIGTHHGFYTLLVHVISKGAAKIHAFEPSKIHYNILKRNIQNKKNIYINNLALYSQEGCIEFYESMLENSSVNTRFFNSVAEESGSLKFSKIKVSTLTLDRYCQRNYVIPTLLKIDVEGAEYDVLLGGEETIKYFPTIIMEICRSPLDNTNHIKAINFLLTHNYSPFKINNEGELEAITEIIPNRDIPLKDRYDNFVFMKV